MNPKIAYTQTFLRKRKFLVALPVLIVPFLTLAFWALGGGRAQTQGRTPADTWGLNLQLPPAHISTETGSKLQFYEQADGDSMRHHHFFTWDNAARSTKIFTDTPFAGNTSAPGHNELTPYGAKAYRDSNEETIYQRLAALQAQIQVSTSVPLGSEAGNQHSQQEHAAAVPKRDIGDLAAVLPQSGVRGRSEGDPELHQLNLMMEKILDIQHPERVNGKLPDQSKVVSDHVFRVRTPKATDSITLLENRFYMPEDTSRETSYLPQESQNGFYSLQSSTAAQEPANTMEAVIDQTQTLVSGATIKLRLLHDVWINGVLIPRDQFLYGTTTLQGERLLVHISSISYENNILPVALSVYDLDGLEGIYVPGTITGDATRQASESMLQGVEVGALNHTLATDIARAGLEASKSLFTRKARLVNVTVKAGYQVLLKDNSQP